MYASSIIIHGVFKPGAVVGDGVATATEVGTGSCVEDVATAGGIAEDGTADWVLVTSRGVRTTGATGARAPPRYFVEGAKGGTACYLEI